MSASLKLNYSMNLETRTIRLVGDIDSDLYLKFSDRLDMMGPGAVNVILNTQGGCVYSALAIYDLIKARKNSVILCEGHVMSAGVLILQSARYRLARPSCQFLVHYGEETNNSGTEVKHNKRLTSFMAGLIQQRVSVTRRTLLGWLDKETYFDVEGALRVGLIDGIYNQED